MLELFENKTYTYFLLSYFFLVLLTKDKGDSLESCGVNCKDLVLLLHIKS